MGLQAECITKYFYYPRTRCIFYDFSVSFSQGEIVAITGDSGSGKSTLLYCLAGIEKVERGRIMCGEHRLNQMSSAAISHVWHRKLAVVLQYPYLINELTIADNIALKKYINGAYHGLEERVSQLLADINMMPYKDAYPDEISGGQQQRVALARALLYPPAFIVTDEPTAHLDDANADALLAVLQQYRDMYGCGVVVATHDYRVIRCADRICSVSQAQEKE